MSVDTARLRDLFATVEKLEAAERATGDVVAQVTHTVADVERDARASAHATGARVALTRAVRADLPALLDELETARALLSEVRERGLAAFGDPAQRIDLTRRVVAYLES